MKANPSDQARLLELADLDTQIAQADVARKNPPQAARVQELIGLRQSQSGELARLRGLRDDAGAEVTRLENDVALVDARLERDAALLASTASVKDAQGLESEMVSLQRRKSDLEDAELEIMERIESIEGDLHAQNALVAATNDEGAALSAAAKAAVADATARFEAATRDRAAVAGDVPADLLATYDRLASRGVGAAALRRRTCEGCRMVLSETDLRDLRAAAEDDVFFCPECGTILVRGEDAGL